MMIIGSYGGGHKILVSGSGFSLNSTVMICDTEADLLSIEDDAYLLVSTPSIAYEGMFKSKYMYDE